MVFSIGGHRYMAKQGTLMRYIDQVNVNDQVDVNNDQDDIDYDQG